MSKHTPGPWRTDRRSAAIAIKDVNGDILGEMYDKTTRQETEWHANASLVAAAPDLLLACQYAANSLRTYLINASPWGASVVEHLDAAIAKAEVKACD